MAEAGDKIAKGPRVTLKALALIRRWTFVPVLIVTVVALVVNAGGSSLAICLNSIAILCAFAISFRPLPSLTRRWSVYC